MAFGEFRARGLTYEKAIGNEPFLSSGHTRQDQSEREEGGRFQRERWD